MGKRIWASVTLIGVLLAPIAVPAAGDDLGKRMAELLAKAPAEGDWQVKAADLAKMIAEKKTDFLVVDVASCPPPRPGTAGRKDPRVDLERVGLVVLL